jgi:ABC-type polysaccharide/polyol phosphate export permease
MPHTAWHYLDVMSVLAQKHFKIRYRNSVLGFLRALLSPLAYVVILTLVFSLRVDIHFAASVLIGLLVCRILLHSNKPMHLQHNWEFISCKQSPSRAIRYPAT